MSVSPCCTDAIHILQVSAHAACWHPRSHPSLACCSHASPPLLQLQISLQVFLGKAQLDIEAILTRQRILLKSIPRGTAKIVFTARDFGHFLAHPLLRQTAATAVQVFISWPTRGPESRNIIQKLLATSCFSDHGAQIPYR